MNFKKGDFPITEKLSNKIISLPIYPEISEVQINYIVNKIKYFFDKN